MKKVFVASKNPVKILACKKWFEKMFPNDVFDFIWVSVDSWVSDQPFSDNETFIWADNRANNVKQKCSDWDFWVGIEWWIEVIWKEMISFARIVIIWKNDIKWRSRTWCFSLPFEVVDLINKWKELWDADDIVFWDSNSKQKYWAVGILTWKIIDRATYYEQSVIFSLIPFLNKNLSW